MTAIGVYLLLAFIAISIWVEITNIYQTEKYQKIKAFMFVNGWEYDEWSDSYYRKDSSEIVTISKLMDMPWGTIEMLFGRQCYINDNETDGA